MNRVVFELYQKEDIDVINDFLSTLLKYNSQCHDDYFDIHIYQEEHFGIIEFEQIPYSHEFGGRFEFLEEDELKVKEIHFPDGHYDYAQDSEHEKELWEEFHKNNPEWVQTSYGTWVNKVENERMEKELRETSDLRGHDWVIHDDEGVL